MQGQSKSKPLHSSLFGKRSPHGPRVQVDMIAFMLGWPTKHAPDGGLTMTPYMAGEVTFLGMVHPAQFHEGR